MGLVTAKEVAQVIKADKFGFMGTAMGWMLMKLLKIDTMNRIYDRNKHRSDLDFMNGLLDEFEIKFEIPEEDLLLLFIGSGFIKKGLDRALLALKALPADLYERCHLYVLGRDNAEPFKRMAIRLGVADRAKAEPGGPAGPARLPRADGTLRPARRAGARRPGRGAFALNRPASRVSSIRRNS